MPPTSRNGRLWIFTAVMTLLFTLVFSVNVVIGNSLNLTAGERAEEDVDAPFSTSFISEVQTRKAREQAMATVPDIYSGIDLGVLRTQINLIQDVFNYIDVVRADALADQETRLRYLNAVEVLDLTPEMAEQILSLSTSEWAAVKSDVTRIVDSVMRNEIRDNSSDALSARDSVHTRISIILNPIQEAVVTNLAAQLIVPNTFLDEQATAARRAEVADAVEPRQVTITQGQRILRVGDTVTDEHIEMLTRLGLLQAQTSWTELAGIFVASLLAVGLMSAFWYRFQTDARDSLRYLLIFALLLLVFVAGAKAVQLAPSEFTFLFPAAALSMLLASIYGLRLALFVTFVVAGLVAYNSGQSLEVAMFAAVGPAFAVLTLRDVSRINAFFRAGLIVAFANVVVILLFRFAPEAGASELLTLLLFGLINGLLISAGITLGGLYLLGGLFGVVTILQLQELSRLDHPLLRELLRRAPGTYHHSIMVANLAEQAAERLKSVDSTLVRVGAFYHDIGKLNRPPFFTENQEGVNPHDSLDPYVSARIIIAHVTDGLALAREYRLPDRIQEFIAQHHGDNLVYAFYRKAVDQAGGNEELVDKSRFRYPGPRPQSPEAGIVMLADSIDATSSALRPNTGQAIIKLVDKIVDDHLQHDQLNSSGLTLGDIELAKASFVDTLKGRFHVRVKYPGNEELEAPATLPALPAGERIPAAIAPQESERVAVTPSQEAA